MKIKEKIKEGMLLSLGFYLVGIAFRLAFFVLSLILSYAT